MIASAFIILLAVQREPEKQPKALSVGVTLAVRAEDGSLKLRRGKPGHNSAEQAPSSRRPIVDRVPQVREPICPSSGRRPHKRQTSCGFGRPARTHMPVLRTGDEIYA